MVEQIKFFLVNKGVSHEVLLSILSIRWGLRIEKKTNRLLSGNYKETAYRGRISKHSSFNVLNNMVNDRLKLKELHLFNVWLQFFENRFN